MSIFSSIPCIPLYPITISDWLPKLGEKAFLAWVHFRSWENQSDRQAPIEISFPLNHIIKRLKVGNSTFYNHILRPLWNHGLIELKREPGMNYFHLLVYSYPKNDPQNMLEPLVPFRDYDDDFHPDDFPRPVQDVNHSSHTVRVTEEKDTLEVTKLEESLSSCSSLPSQDIPSPVDPIDLSSHPIHHLPPSLAIPIQSDPALLLRQEQIEMIYMRWKDHACYTDESFLYKIKVCVPYNQDIHRFAAYLHKALLNEWKDKPSSSVAQPSFSPPPPPLPPRPRDVPEWVWMQQYGPKVEPQECSAEQNAILEDLKRQLGIIP